MKTVYQVVGSMVENVGILGIAIIGLLVWATISTLCAKKKTKAPPDLDEDFY